MTFCLPKELTDKFRQGLQSKEIDPEKLRSMDSEERRGYLADFVGKDNAKEVNALFESKLLLKNQQAGFKTWAKKVAGLSPATRQDLISRIERMDKVLNPEDKQSFLADLAAKKLGADVTVEEAKTLTDLSKKTVDSRQNWNGQKWTNEDDRLDYGAKYVALQNYVKELKGTDTSFLERAQGNVKESGAIGGTARSATDFISTVSGIAKGVKASFDDSFLGRQGFKTMFTNPVTWAKNAAGSFELIGKQLMHKATNEDVLNALKADIYSRPNAMNGMYTKAKLDIGNTEESYPVSAVEHVPILGRFFKASEVAFEGTAYRLRADVFDHYLTVAQKGGVDLTQPTQVRSIGKLVNSLTGRGDLGSLEKVGKTVNNIFFSPKFLKSNFDFLTAHLFDDTSRFAKREAAYNLGRVVIGTSTILTIANALMPGSVETDPHSADFGKIKIGDTRFDVTGGMGSLVVLAARIGPLIAGQQSYVKSTATGKKQPLNTGTFGSKTGLDLFNDFFENRTSPGMGLLLDMLKGQDNNFQKPTVIGETKSFAEPFVAQNIEESLADPNSANVVLTEILDGLGFSENTYSSTKKKP
jgi:hypothetical protein